MKSSSLDVTKKLFLYLLVILSIIALARLFFFEYRLLNYPYQWELREALQLHHGILLSEGKPIYAVSPDPPVVLEPYGPVNPFLLTVAVKIFGKDLSGPRLFSFLAFLITLLLIAVAVYRLTHSWMFVLIAIGINTFILSWVRWLLLCRPDSLGGMLLFASIFVHWLYPFRKAAVGASLLLTILAFFTKTYFALGLMLIPLNYWFFHRNRRMAILYLISGSALLVASVAAAQRLTGGLYYLFTFKLMSQWVTYSFVHLLETTKGLFVYFLPLFALIVYAILKKEFRYRVLNVFWIHILVGIPIFMFFLLNTGAETYYWYAVIPALTVVGVDVLYKECQKEKSPFAVAMLVLLFCLMTNKMIISETIKDGMVFPSEKLASQWQPVVAEFDRNTDQILNDDATAILAIRAGKRLHREGLGYLNIKNAMEKELYYKFRDIDAEIASRNYSLIINPENESYVKQYYRLDRVYHVPIQLGECAWSLKMYVPGYRPEEQNPGETDSFTPAGINSAK
ncbi:MAG: hypothetical protein PHR27_09375 [Candidatus Cloacimonetes bacterium]|nr:hypothetical protein [Candidatus Cloacimonadota bacterium]